MDSPSVSVIFPALNEEANLAETLDMTVKAIVPKFVDYEFIVIDDGSTDGTRRVAEALAAEDERIRVVHHERNMGLGYSFREGVELATKDVIGWLPSDSNGVFSQPDLDRVFQAVGEADFVLLYVTRDARSRLRRTISRSFVWCMNRLFDLDLRYYNGANFFRARLVKSMREASDGYGLFSGLVVRLLRQGASYLEVGVVNRDDAGSSKALRWRNVVQVVTMVAGLIWSLHVTRRKENARPQVERPVEQASLT